MRCYLCTVREVDTVPFTDGKCDWCVTRLQYARENVKVVRYTFRQFVSDLFFKGGDPIGVFKTLIMLGMLLVLGLSFLIGWLCS